MANRTLLYVLGVTPDKLGGIELFAREMAVQLGRVGWDVVLCFESDPPPRVRRAFDLPNVTLAPLPGQASVGLRGAARFTRLLLEHRPSVVVYSFHCMLKPYPWLARALSVERVYYNDHSSDWRAPSRSRLRALLVRATRSKLDGIVGVSRYVQRRAVAMGLVAPERAFAVHNGVDLRANQGAEEQARAFRERYRIPPGRRIVSQTSYMVKHKGIDTLLRAAPAVLAAVPDVQFVLVGDGEQRPVLEWLARRLGVTDHVTWAGVVQQPTAEGVFAASDVCCQLSRWNEAFGLSLAEAMSFGCPVIATRVGGIPELVRDGENGFLVDRDDAPAVARRLVQLLSDEDLRRRLGRAGRRVAEERFDLTRTVARYLEIFGVTAERGAPAPLHDPARPQSSAPPQIAWTRCKADTSGSETICSGDVESL